MTSILYTTLAVGEKYLNAALDFSNKLYVKDPGLRRIVVSDINNIDVPPNTTIVPLEDNSAINVCNAFNYNLKYQAIKACVSWDAKYIIYTDADWILSDHYDSNKIYKFLDENSPDIDFFFERPHQIGHSKHNWNECFWRNKIEPYQLLATDKYDKAHVPNEQFMLFKNSSKLDLFVSSWKQKNDFCVQNNVWTFAEGVEIGMSAVDAEMLTQWSTFYTISHCFEFYSVLGQHYIRF